MAQSRGIKSGTSGKGLANFEYFTGMVVGFQVVVGAKVGGLLVGAKVCVGASVGFGTVMVGGGTATVGAAVVTDRCKNRPSRSSGCARVRSGVSLFPLSRSFAAIIVRRSGCP